MLHLVSLLLAALLAPAAPSPAWATKPLRAGIIGTDTSHVQAFTRAFREHPEWKITVVAACRAAARISP